MDAPSHNPFCPACGEPRADTSARFCTHCGARISGVFDPLIGRVLGGTYRIDAPLAFGGMGRVYRGLQLGLERPVAIKMVLRQEAQGDASVRRLLREARAASRFDHPSSVAVYQLGESEDGDYFIAMELVEGRSLREALEREGPFPAERAVRLCTQLLAALSEAHRAQVLHRDLKPDNILLTLRRNPQGGQDERLKVIDFGLARVDTPDASVLTVAGAGLGTPQYLSPEQASGERVDARSDLYAVGAILYEMLTGETVFPADSAVHAALQHLAEAPTPLRERRPELNISEALERVCLRALEKSPAQRFQSARHMARALEEAETHETDEEAPATLISRPGVPVLVEISGHPPVELTVRDFGPRALFVVAEAAEAPLPLLSDARVVFRDGDAPPLALGARIVYRTSVRELDGVFRGYGVELQAGTQDQEARIDALLAPVRRSENQSVTPPPLDRRG